MKQSLKQGKKNKVGAYGEEIAAKYLKKAGFSILEQNYLKKWGEIDLVTRKGHKIHFVEVKTVSYETVSALKYAIDRGDWRPEENVTAQKLHKMNKAIESWLGERREEMIDWQIDVIAVRIVPHEKYASVKYIENVIV